MKILVIHGPNLNLLGEREPGVYGSETFEKLNSDIMAHAEELGVECEIYQSNHEGAIIDRLHEARKDCAGVVLNAGAYTQLCNKRCNCSDKNSCYRSSYKQYCFKR